MQATNRKLTASCTLLLGTGKEGILTPDADGYYTVVLGAYGAYNNVGMYYDLPSAQNFFKQGSPLLRWVEKGILRGEYKHPMPTNGMSDEEYIQRIRQIDADRVSHHIRKVYLKPGKDEQGRAIMEVVGEVRPSGPYGNVLKDALDNKHENVYFSVRSLTVDDVMRGIKYTRELITWDYVNEGGIAGAHKYNSPALEHFTLETIQEVNITPNQLWSLANEQAKRKQLGLESDQLDYHTLIKEMQWELEKPVGRTPIYAKW